MQSCLDYFRTNSYFRVPFGGKTMVLSQIGVSSLRYILKTSGSRMCTHCELQCPLHTHTLKVTNSSDFKLQMHAQTRKYKQGKRTHTHTHTHWKSQIVVTSNCRCMLKPTTQTWRNRWSDWNHVSQLSLCAIWISTHAHCQHNCEITIFHWLNDCL